MTLKPVHVELSVAEVQRVLAIALDEDGREALVFVRDLLAKRVEKALQKH